jgi:hypothetical protein
VITLILLVSLANLLLQLVAVLQRHKAIQLAKRERGHLEEASYSSLR